MKVLSIEEKAKRYDEALERARNLHKDAIDMEENLRAKQCEIIFPELAESEDERIRKALIRFHKSTINIDGIKGANVIAWLEKQGKQMSDKIEPKFKVGDTIQTKQGQMKFVIGRIDNEYYRREGNNASMLRISDQDYWELVEQKPIEDVDLPEFESHLCLMFQKFRTKGICTNGEIIDYVKEHSQKLKDILVKPAWSEEDERIIKRIDSLLYSQCKIHGSEYEEIYNWLKSLKERYTWNPSDKQMEQLGWIAEQNKDNMIGKELMSLYQDLKKLKG